MVAPWSPEAAQEVLAAAAGEEPGSVLLALQGVQGAFGYVPDAAIPLVAEACNASRADVHGVLTFYSDLRREPPADVTIRVCLGEACQSVGARDLLSQARLLTRPDGATIEVSHVYCLGNCALGPAAVVNGRLLGRATTEAVAAAATQAAR